MLFSFYGSMLVGIQTEFDSLNDGVKLHNNDIIKTG